MKKKNGFTLVELLTTIIVLAIVLLIASTSILGIMSSVKKNAVKQSVVSITRAAKTTYMNESLEDELDKTLILTYTNGDETSNISGVNLEYTGDDIQDGYIVVKDEKVALSLYNDGFCAEKEITSDEIIITEEPKATCITDITSPTFAFPLGETINHEINTPIPENYFEALTITKEQTDNYTSTITFNGTPTSNIDNDVLGTYVMNLSLTEEGKTVNETLTINIVDTTKPIINNVTPITIYENQIASFNPLTGITVTDNSLETITPTYDSYTLSGAGVFYITYRAVDSSGNSATPVSREVTVIDTTNPAVAFGTNGNATYGTSRSSTVTVTDLGGVNSSSLEYQWTTSTTTPTEASFTTAFTNGGTITSPAGVTGTYYLWVIAKDNSNNTTIIRTNVFNLDNIAPAVAFGTNGNATYGTSRSSTVTITDANSGVSAASLEYQWTTSTTTPTEASFVTTFTSGGTITSPAGVTGTYYLWILAKDSASNTTITRTNVFNLDNTAPAVAFGTNGNATYAKTRTSTVTITDANSGVSAASLEYQWTTSTTTPTEASFTTAFTNGGTITSPAGVTGTYYLWILAKDSATNTTITRSNLFNLDNTAPVITVTGGAASIALGATYTDQGATATDTISGNLTSSIGVTNPVNINTANVYTVTYSVTDGSGNTATATRTVTVNPRTEYRYRDYSCSSCSSTCYNYTSYTSTTQTCTSPLTLSGGVCTHSYGISSTTYPQYYCQGSTPWTVGGTWNSCTGNCSQACDPGYSNSGGSSSPSGCPSGSCPNSYWTTDNCYNYWSATCTKTAAPTTTYNCPGGYSWNGSQCQQSYTCYYDCNCAWGSWSGWSTTVYTASGTREVETRQITSI